MKIMLAIDLKEKHLQRIREALPGIEISKALEATEQARELPGTEVLVVFGGNFPLDLLAEAKNLKWIQSWSAGVDQLTRPEIVKTLVARQIKLTTMSGVHADIIAEQVLGYLISFSRKLYKYYRQQEKQIWQKLQMDQLEGRTLAIIGTGQIGQEIGRRAKAFKMKTLGIKKDITEKLEGIDELYTPDELHPVLSRADYVVLAVPLTDETTGMFGKEEFRAMKDSAYFINISRGKVVVEEELILALEEGWIAGAALDVFVKEPLPGDSPLYRLENVLITPHTAGIFPDYNQKAIGIFVENLKRYASGQELINLVDYNRGY